MRQPRVRALQGLALSAGSPLGWLLLRWFDGASPVIELLAHPGVYLYMLFGTAIAFAGFGWYVGHREEIELDNALHDPLTGLYNRRYFWRRFEDERAFAGRHSRPLALLVGDIDLFKRVNDSYGHTVGDVVLTSISRTLMQLRRRGDTVARVGGEEFAVILPETDLAEAVRVADRFREAIGQLEFEFDRERYGRFRVTMSFGAAVAEGNDILPAAELFQRADAAMYRAKQAGRNRVMMADMPAASPSAAPAVSAAP